MLGEEAWLKGQAGQVGLHHQRHTAWGPLEQDWARETSHMQEGAGEKAGGQGQAGPQHADPREEGRCPNQAGHRGSGFSALWSPPSQAPSWTPLSYQSRSHARDLEAAHPA